MAKSTPLSPVAVIVGSDSDLPVVQRCTDILKQFDLAFDLRILSAHRTPKELVKYVTSLEPNGCRVVIAAAGLSAALPGSVAAHTNLPVIGIPIDAGTLSGIDALLSITQMPPGVPVATVAIGSVGARNAALLAVRILAINDTTLAKKLTGYADDQRKAVLKKDRDLDRSE